METFRLLQPKLYNYKDVVNAEFAGVGLHRTGGWSCLELALTDRCTEWVPNVYELANAHADGTV